MSRLARFCLCCLPSLVAVPLVVAFNPPAWGAALILLALVMYGVVLSRVV